MIKEQGQHAGRSEEARQRRGRGIRFVAGFATGLAFFAFFPGLPHVIDWGALLVSLAVGLLAGRTSRR